MSEYADWIVKTIGAETVSKIIENAEPKFKCPNCYYLLGDNQTPCPKCGTPLRW